MVDGLTILEVMRDFWESQWPDEDFPVEDAIEMIGAHRA